MAQQSNSSTAGESRAPARFKDLCIDAVDLAPAARFWSAALGLSVQGSIENVHLSGATPQHTVWLNEVPEQKTVKNRVHLDVHAGSVEELVDRGARVVQPAGEDSWTVLGAPDGQEFCAFVRTEVPDYRLYELVVDCKESEPIARWWAQILGARTETDSYGDWALTGIPGAPLEYLVFQPVPEPKTVKNRVHWDVSGNPDELVGLGATLLRARGGDIGWHVLADPDGNEFCAFNPDP